MRCLRLAIILSTLLLIAPIHASGGDLRMRHGRSFINGLYFLNSGKNLLSVSMDGTIVLWNARTGAKVWKLDLDSERTKDRFTISNILGSAVSPNEKLLAITFDRSSVIKKPDRNVLQDDRIEKTALVDLAKGKIARTLCDGRNEFAFSPDGRTLTTVGSNSKALFWDVDSGTITKQMEMKSCCGTPIFTPSGKAMIVADRLSYDAEPMVSVYDFANGNIIRNFPKQYVQIIGLALSPDGRLLAIGGFSGGVYSLKLWDLQDSNKSELRNLVKANECLGSYVKFSTSGKLLASSGLSNGRGIVSIQNVQDGKTVKTFTSSSDIKFLEFAPDAGRLAFSTENGEIFIKALKTVNN